MKYVIILLLAFTGCAHTHTEERRAKVLDCTKELIDMDSGTKESYEVCKDLYTRQNK